MKTRNLFEIRIIDGGIGLSEEIFPFLFDKFVTKAPSEHFDKMGAGLGLYIARSIIQAHGGHIFAGNNASGIGCTFVVRLPISGK
jgi:signal transduction histidine kinase